MSTASALQLLPPTLLSPSPVKRHFHPPHFVSFSTFQKPRKKTRLCCSSGSMKDKQVIQSDIDCVGTGSDVECFLPSSVELDSESESDQLLSSKNAASFEIDSLDNGETENDSVQKVTSVDRVSQNCIQ
jgi:hypothetical protein